MALELISYLCFREGNGNPLHYSCLENPMDRGGWWAAVHRVAQSWTWLSDLACMHALEKEMATHSSILAWRVPGTEEPRGLPDVGSHRVGHDWSSLAVAATSIWIFFFCFSLSLLPSHWHSHYVYVGILNGIIYLRLSLFFFIHAPTPPHPLFFDLATSVALSSSSLLFFLLQVHSYCSEPFCWT